MNSKDIAIIPDMPGKKFLFLVIVVLTQLITSCSSDTSDGIETYTIRKGDFLFTVTETGELEAVKALTISAPAIPWNMGSLKITKIVEDGSEVEANDILIEFDKGEVQKSMEDAQSELEIAQAE